MPSAAAPIGSPRCRSGMAAGARAARVITTTSSSRASSTPSQTAWGILGLLAGGHGRSTAVQRGVAHLLETQRADGEWDESLATGTGFPNVFYLRFTLYRNYFPLLALVKAGAEVGAE